MKTKILGLALLLVSLARPSVASTIVAVQPGSASLGHTFFVDVTIADVTDLIGYQFEVGFNASVLAANSIEDGPFLSTAGTAVFADGAIDNLLGTIGLTGSSLTGSGPGASTVAAAVLARISFTAIGLGPGDIKLSSGLILDSSLAGIQAAFNGASITVTPAAPSEIPEPSTLALVGAGVAAAWQRRSQARTN